MWHASVWQAALRPCRTLRHRLVTTPCFPETTRHTLIRHAALTLVVPAAARFGVRVNAVLFLLLPLHLAHRRPNDVGAHLGVGQQRPARTAAEVGGEVPRMRQGRTAGREPAASRPPPPPCSPSLSTYPRSQHTTPAFTSHPSSPLPHLHPLASTHVPWRGRAVAGRPGPRGQGGQRHDQVRLPGGRGQAATAADGAYGRPVVVAVLLQRRQDLLLGGRLQRPGACVWLRREVVLRA